MDPRPDVAAGGRDGRHHLRAPARRRVLLARAPVRDRETVRGHQLHGGRVRDAGAGAPAPRRLAGVGRACAGREPGGELWGGRAGERRTDCRGAVARRAPDRVVRLQCRRGPSARRDHGVFRWPGAALRAGAMARSPGAGVPWRGPAAGLGTTRSLSRFRSRGARRCRARSLRMRWSCCSCLCWSLLGACAVRATLLHQPLQVPTLRAVASCAVATHENRPRTIRSWGCLSSRRL